MDLFTLAPIRPTGVDPVKMIQAPTTDIEHAIRELEGVKAKMREVLLRLEETQKPGHQARVERVSPYNCYYVKLFHCVPVATRKQRFALQRFVLQHENQL